MDVYYQTFATPVGNITAACNDHHLLMLGWESSQPLHAKVQRRLDIVNATWHSQSHPILDQTRQQLDAYFNGQLKHFSVPLALRGTDFQKKVWRALLAIPWGTTISYAELAKAIDNPLAVRAVANANGANALPIIVPCHRVIGSDGGLAGYTGGTHIKRHLLATEGISFND